MNKWVFPSIVDGQVKGVADAGIENFNGTELASLARENCQNSLDAALDDDNPNVIVEFERYFIDSSQIPGIQTYRDILEQCKAFWDKSKSEKAKHFLNTAIKASKKDKVFALRVSDFNTTGLADPYGDVDPASFNFDGWNSLIKIDGGANKGDDKAGAFGIGKSAPFCNSDYRLVFYRTLNQENERATQGVSRIMSYPVETVDGKTAYTTGVGYFGDSNGNKPVECIDEIEALHQRDSVGTDVFVYGFHGGGSEWETEIVKAVLDSFLMSLFDRHLIVKIQGSEINYKTLGAFMSRLHTNEPGASKSTYGNYLALTRTEGTYEYTKDFHGMGSLRLRILVDPNEKLDRKILIVRKAGMKLFRLGNLSKLVPFTGVLELNGKEINSYFRKMETVAHDNWEPGRHENPKQAKAYYEEIKEWIRDIIANLAENTSDDEIDVKGLSGVLQKEEDIPNSGDSEAEKESLNNHLGTIEVRKYDYVSSSKGLYFGYGSSGRKSTEQTAGTIGDDGTEAVRKLRGKRHRKKIEKHRGVPNPEGKDIVEKKKTGGEDNRSLKNVRIIKQGNASYSVGFEVPTDVESGRVEIVTVGENGKSNVLRVKAVSKISGCTSVTAVGGRIEATGMKAGEKVRINITLLENRDYAMEVNVYANN